MSSVIPVYSPEDKGDLFLDGLLAAFKPLHPQFIPVQPSSISQALSKKRAVIELPSEVDPLDVESCLFTDALDLDCLSFMLRVKAERDVKCVGFLQNTMTGTQTSKQINMLSLYDSIVLDSKGYFEAEFPKDLNIQTMDFPFSLPAIRKPKAVGSTMVNVLLDPSTAYMAPSLRSIIRTQLHTAIGKHVVVEVADYKNLHFEVKRADVYVSLFPAPTSLAARLPIPLVAPNVEPYNHFIPADMLLSKSHKYGEWQANHASVLALIDKLADVLSGSNPPLTKSSPAYIDSEHQSGIQLKRVLTNV